MLVRPTISDYGQIMSRDAVATVRRFHRLVTQRVGALEESYLDRGRSLGQARLLFEIGPRGAELRTLRNRLGLDSGYLSRLLRALEGQGLVAIRPDTVDRRARRISLTPKGEVEYAAYDRLSNALASDLLSGLDPEERPRLLRAMGDVCRLLSARDLDIRSEPPGSPDALTCLQRYFEDLAARFETGFDPARSISATDQELSPPAGYFVLARLSGDPVGCGGLKRHEDGIGEIKRMWTSPAARGLGIARRVLAELEREAGAMGLRVLRLETNRALTEAQALYRTCGYKEVAPFSTEPYAHHWFEKAL